MAIILSINAGSSSVKVSVYKVDKPSDDPKNLAEAELAGLTAPPPQLSYTRGSHKFKGKPLESSAKVSDQAGAFTYLLDYLQNDKDLTEISDLSAITHICHRVVHGGEYPHAQEINRETYHRLEELTDLAPLHNQAALGIVRLAHETLPHAKNLAIFDSSFHKDIPDHVRTYPIDQEIARRNGLRKYGFHGISYGFITRTVAEYLQKEPHELNIIALHLGSGASICAIKCGRSADTTMGLTPLAGLPGATRSGSVDPSLVFHFTHDAGMPSRSATKELHITNAEEILNKKSGWKAMTGTTDFGEISRSQKPECKLAFDLFVDRITGFVGAYYLKLEGKVDALVFAGGIGEKGARLRKEVIEKCKCIGFALDDKRNEDKVEKVVEEIGKQGAKHKTLIVQTDEQYEMARTVSHDPKLY